MTTDKTPFHASHSEHSEHSELNQVPTGSGSSESDKVQELTWELCDDCISDEDRSQLGQILDQSSDARAAYIDAVQLHVDLIEIFNPVSLTPPTPFFPN